MLSSTLPVYENSIPQISVISGLRVRQDLIFSNHKGEEKGRVRKRTEKSLEKLAEPLQKVLAQDEVIVYVVRCLAAVSPLEQLFLGWTAQYALAVTLVFTNQRLLHFSSDRKGAWRRSSIRSLEWSQICAVRMKGWPSPLLEVIHSNNKKQRYWSLPFWERKKLRQLVSILTPAQNLGSGSEWNFLCPECVKPLTPTVFNCGNCGVAFKDMKTMRWRSILVPGGGYFYCGQPFLGVLHALGDSFVLLFITILGVGLAISLLGLTGSNGETLDVTGTSALLLFYVGIFALEKAVAFSHCRRFINEFIPTNRRTLGTTSKMMGVGSS